MSALKSPNLRRSSAPELMSPSLSSERSLSPTPEVTDSFTFEISDLMLPASTLESELFGASEDSNATVVSSASFEVEASSSESSVGSAGTPKASRVRRGVRKASSSERRHSLPSTLLLARTPLGEAITSPVPEFLCHLFSMLRDPSYSDLISWEVPTKDEPDHMGGGIKGIGKIVCHRPDKLQEDVLGRYYRHSKYASFQRQLNYFGFKKRLHGGKKGKLCPCSYIHEKLTDDAGSLFALKRRPPSRKRLSVDDVDTNCSASVSSQEDKSVSSASTAKSTKKRRLSSEKKSKKDKKDRSSKKDGSLKKDGKDKKQSSDDEKQVSIASAPLQVQAEEYAPPSTQSASAIQSNQFKPAAPFNPAPAQSASTSMDTEPLAPPRDYNPACNSGKQTPTVTFSNTVIVRETPARIPQPTLMELLSTELPPSEVLFNDDNGVESEDVEFAPAWVTDDGRYYHNVDNSLIDLAMIY